MGRLVYSSEKGKLCPDCGQPVDSCKCAELKKQQILGSGKVRVRREVKGRGGKAVTVVTGLPLNSEELGALSKGIKRMLGVGGAVKQGNIEIQGDHVERVLDALKKEGFSAKKGGG